jgi:hypothetical protein
LASQPFDVPKQFLEDLHTYDDKLRVRWDFRDEYWRVERKVRRGREASSRDFTNQQDWEATSDGYVVVLRVPPDCLNRQVIHALALGDIQRRGGWKAVAAQMEAHERGLIDASNSRFADYTAYQAAQRWNGWNTNYPMTKFGRSGQSRGGSMGRG